MTTARGRVDGTAIDSEGIPTSTPRKVTAIINFFITFI